MRAWQVAAAVFWGRLGPAGRAVASGWLKALAVKAVCLEQAIVAAVCKKCIIAHLEKRIQ